MSSSNKQLHYRGRESQHHQQQQHHQEQKVDSDMQQLKQLIPGLKTNGNVSQVEIMQEAARYIDKLQNNLICHIRTHGYPEKLKTLRKNSSNSSSSFQDSSESIKRTVESYIVGNKLAK